MIDLQRRTYLNLPTKIRRIGAFYGTQPARYVMLLLFCGYMIFAIWGCTSAKISLEPEEFLDPKSAPGKFLKKFRENYPFSSNYVELIFDRPLNYFDLETRKTIETLLNWAEENRFSRSVTSWIRDFENFEKKSVYFIDRNTFVAVVRMIFLRSPRFSQYESDIVFGPYEESIARSRIYVELSPHGEKYLLEMVQGLQKQAQQLDLL